VWQGTDGRVHNASGADVPSVAVDGSTVFVDVGHSVWGAFDTGSTVTGVIARGGPTGLDVVMPDESVLASAALDGATRVWTFRALVHAEASEPTVTYATGCTPVGDPTIVPLPDVPYAVLQARCSRLDGDTDAAVTGYRYGGFVVPDDSPHAMVVTPWHLAVLADHRLVVPAVGDGSAHRSEEIRVEAQSPEDVTFYVTFRRLQPDFGFISFNWVKLPGRQKAVFQLGDMSSDRDWYTMAYGVTRSRPTQVTPVGDTPGRFAGGTAFSARPLPGTDLWAVAISLTGTEASPVQQLTAVTWTDATGNRHTTPVG
jgi:hypothetical protein